MYSVLMVLHVAVLGYWLGAEFVINSTFRHVSRSRGMPFDERSRLLDHVMNVDQHVRYALILQLGSGLLLVLKSGYFSNSMLREIMVVLAAALWLLLVEVTHRLRKQPTGVRLARIDAGLRWILITGLLATAAMAQLGAAILPAWLSLKLGLFALVIACGLGIRGSLSGYFDTFRAIGTTNNNDELEEKLLGYYRSATSILIVLWALIAAIVATSLSRWSPSLPA